MRYILSTLTGLAVALAVPAAPVAAQAPAAITVGMQVTDASGAPVGTVKAIQGDDLLITTGKHEALLPKASFTPADGKLLFGMTQAQLNTEIEKAGAAADAAIVAGATVKGSDGATIGTIEAVTADGVTITLPSGKKVQVAKSSVRGNADGSVVIGLSAAQIEAQVGASSVAAAPAPTGK